MDNSIAAIILAAGKGTRMKAPPTQNKVVFKLDEKPIIAYTVDMLKNTGLKKIVVVVGFASQSVRDVLGDQVDYALQSDPKGTGDAVKKGLQIIPSQFKTVISMYGDDSAFYTQSLVEKLVEEHQNNQASITVLTIHKDNPTGLGRIIRDKNNTIQEIVEEKNASEDQKKITEINTGLYCFDRSFLDQAIPAITPNSVSGEYYLTDVVGYATKHAFKIHALMWPDKKIWYGVNSPDDLKEAEMRMKQKSAVK